MRTSHSADDLFAGALALPASERDCYLQRACTDDLELLARVQSLLAAFAEAANFFVESTDTQLGRGGEQIDDYRLIEELGQGGGGVVYLAEQTNPIKREVALKIIKLGMDTNAVIARFEAERQALAMMDHPNIARVFDAGATTNGRPYFVMELVRGIKITDYCDQCRLRVDERLALFIQVCQAIQHAHQKGIIHRDVKPSNVLVTLHDGMPVAKVIDFGIAKATQGRLTGQTVCTAFEQFIGTPAYVSPEQTNPANTDIDTRSDIYSLGVLLYEMLTGCTPFDTTELLQAGLDEMRRRIRTDRPPDPSKRLRTELDALAVPSSCRRTVLTKVLEQLKRDLDWVVMRCLEKERDRRYQSVNDLILELQRYTQQQPVLARPQSAVYAMRKFVSRHRLGVALATAGLLVIILAVTLVAAMAIQSNRVAAERARAERESQVGELVSEFMLDVLSAADPYRSQRADIDSRDVLEYASGTLNEAVHQRADIRARLLESIGRTYRRRGELYKALDHLYEAVRIRTTHGEVSEKITAATELGLTLLKLGEIDRATELLDRAIVLADEHGIENSRPYAQLLNIRGRAALSSGNVLAARTYFERSHALHSKLFGSNSKEVAEVLLQVALTHQWDDDAQKSEQLAREALDILSVHVQEEHPDRVVAVQWLGQALYLQGRLTEAATLFEQALRSQARLFGNNSTPVADSLDSLAAVRRAQGQLKQAEALARDALRIHIAVAGQEHIVTAYYRTSLSGTLILGGKYGEAEQQLRHALKTYQHKLPADHQYVASAEHWLAEIFLATGRLKDAETMFITAMARWKRAKAPEWRASRAESGLGEALRRQGRAGEAERHLADSYRVLIASPTADRHAREKARERLERFYKDRGERQKLAALKLTTSPDHTPGSVASSN